MNDEEFIKICEESDSMAMASRKANMPFTTFVRRAKNLNCYSPNQSWSKGKTSLSDSRIRTKYKNIFVENSKMSRSQLKRIILRDNKLEYKCALCDLSPAWNGKFLSLHIDHINGVRNDNKLSNLRFLCPNCHSQTETYCSSKKTTSLSSYDLSLIIESISRSNSITGIIRDLGILDTDSNRIKIKSIMNENLLSFSIKPQNNVDGNYFCKCGSSKRTKISNSCSKCAKLVQRRVERPPIEIILREVKELGYCATGRKYGVTDNAIRKWIKNYIMPS